MDTPDTSPTNEELQGVKDVIASLLIALKNYFLYPENHSICQKSLTNTASRLDGFLKSHGDLRLDVAKDGLLYKTEAVLQEQAGTENLATVFYRDGIQWVQFLEGFEFDELKGFFRIIKEYKNWQEDADGDLATALWEASFNHLRYEATDVYWESEPLIDYSLLNAGDTRNCASEDDEPEDDYPGELALAFEDAENTPCGLSAEEERKLRNIIIEEENRDNLNDLLFIVFVLLKDKTTNEDFKLALEFLETELKESLMQADFQFAFRLVSGLSKMRRSARDQNMWGIDDLDRFFLKISSLEVLSVVPENFQSLDDLDSETVKLFVQFFLLLHPNATLCLGPLLNKTRSPSTQQKILQIIGTLATQDMGPLEKLLTSNDDSMVKNLVSVLGQLKGEKPIQLLFRLLRHSSDGVRKEAVRQLEPVNDEAIKNLFGLIEDPNDSVRDLVIRKLGKIRNETSENLFLDYLEKKHYTIKKHQHLLSCYHALGRSGSSRSIPFLKKSLFSRFLFTDLGSIHRRGSTVALLALEAKESEEILQRASKSIFPTVRLAYRKALEVGQ